MLSLTARVLVFGIGVALASGGSALAMVQCPSNVDGKPLRKTDGGTLFLGQPVDNMEQVPDNVRTSPNGFVSTWTFKSGAGFNLLCRYEGSSQTVLLSLPPETRQCRSDVGARSFVCQ